MPHSITIIQNREDHSFIESTSGVSEGLIQETPEYLRYLYPHIVHMVIEGKGVIKNNSYVLRCVHMLNRMSI